MVRRKEGTKRNEESFRFLIIIQATLLFVALTLINKFEPANCEAKEFDWSELGVALSNPKSAISNNASNNYRILVSPQRRITKNYEFDYTNGSQPVSNGETTYVIPGSGSSYGSHSGSHASAYSALSASLASLKNRLNARGVSLTSPEQSSQGSIYSTGANTYALNEAQPANGQPQNQPTYLSVTNQQDQQSVGYGAGSHGQSGDNKTIVLAIPAKINFLTENRSLSSSKVQQQPQQQQQHQQLTVLQPPNEQQPRAEYGGKQLGLINTQDGSVVDQSGQIVGRDAGVDQEHQQYVIVNSPQQPNENPQLVATNGGSAPTQVYTNVYPTVQQPSVPYTVKYVPTYQQTVQAPTVPKLYTGNSEPVSNQESAVHESTSVARYPSSCPETCNPNDSRWRKYSVSKYKSCCSRSTQYDPHYDHPSSDKVSEASFRYADDSYYGYLYRKSRARRSRKSHRSNRHYKYPTAATHDDETPANEGGQSDSSRPYRPYDASFSKYYKSRQQPVHDSTEASVKDVSLDTGLGGTGRYTKERSYRRGRARDFDAPESATGADISEDDGVYPETATRGSTGYGSGEYSVEAGRYPPEARTPTDEEESRPTYEDVSDVDTVKQGDVSEYSGEAPYETSDDTDVDSLTGQKKYKEHRRRKTGKGRLRKPKETYGKHSKRSRRNRYKQEHSNQPNGTDYESVQSDEQYHPEQSANTEDEQVGQKESPTVEGVEIDKDLTSNKYKSNYNDTASANLSKTTMHLKEILSLLEKKAQLKLNETNSAYLGQSQQPPQPQQQSTSTPPPPITTTSLYNPSLFRSQYDSIGSSPSLHGGLSSSDYLGSEFSLKNPYRFDTSSLSSSISSPSLSSVPSSFSSLGSDIYSPILGYAPRDYGLSGSRPPAVAGGPHARKRRVPKNRYNHMMLPKPTYGVGGSSYLGGAAGKSALLSSYYALNYPYLYRATNPSVTTSYPYKNLNKSPYASLLSSKLAGTGGFYSDESRIHSLTYDPISSVASSLRPSSAMRMRSKPFVFNPHVMPIYTRHSLLSQPLDVKK